MTFDEAHRVIKRGDSVRLRSELENRLSANLSNRYSCTLLMLAAMSGNTAIGRMLIEKGADLNERSISGETALSLAIKSGHTAFVALLLTSGASLDCDPDGNSLEAFLDWVEKYRCNGNDAARMKNIRELFARERT